MISLRILPVDGGLVTLDFGDGVSDFCKLLGLWGNDALCLQFASLLDDCGLSGSPATGGSGFALSTKGVESNLCDEGTNEGTDFDGKCICITAAVGSHVFNSVH